MADNFSITLDRMVDRCQRLYTLPMVAVRVLQLTDSPSVDVRALKQCIENDPALTGKVLRVVNSSLFGLSREVSDLNQAIALLGINPLKLLVLGFSLPDTLFANVNHDILRRYWHHSLIKAVAAREISQTIWNLPGDEAFIAGLLQDLGMLVLLQEFGVTYADFLDQALARAHDLAASEQRAFGFDHLQLSSRLLERWALPHDLVAAIQVGQDPVRLAALPIADRPLPQILHLADLLAKVLAENRCDLLAELLDAGQRYHHLTHVQLTRLVEALQSKVDQLAEVLCLDLPTGHNYCELLNAAHGQLSSVAEQVAGQLVYPGLAVETIQGKPIAPRASSIAPRASSIAPSAVAATGELTNDTAIHELLRQESKLLDDARALAATARENARLNSAGSMIAESGSTDVMRAELAGSDQGGETSDLDKLNTFSRQRTNSDATQAPRRSLKQQETSEARSLAAFGAAQLPSSPATLGSNETVLSNETILSDESMPSSEDAFAGPTPLHARVHGQSRTPARHANQPSVRQSTHARSKKGDGSEYDPALAGRVASAVAACRQARCPLSLLLIELDSYDELLLRRGALHAEQLVQAVGEACRLIDHPHTQCMQTSDLQLAVIAADCDRRQAVELGSEIAARVRLISHRTGNDETRPTLSVSIGVSSLALPPKNFPAADLIASAERCLGGARLSGGNTVKSIEIY